MTFGHLVQVLAAIAIIAGVIAAVLMFIRMLRSGKAQRGVLKKFLLVELILIIVVGCGWILFRGLPGSVVGFIIVSMLLAALANLPVAIIAKLIMIILPKKTE